VTVILLVGWRSKNTRTYVKSLNPTETLAFYVKKLNLCPILEEDEFTKKKPYYTIYNMPVPGTPQHVDPISLNTAVILSWGAPDGEPASYRVQYEDATSSVTTNTTDTSLLIQNLTNGFEYTFYV